MSWADSDIIIQQCNEQVRIEVKASAVWQSWKLVNEDGSAKAVEGPLILHADRIRFGGLKARSGNQWKGERVFKSNFYIFCMQKQTDPKSWDAWDLSQWEFFMHGRAELEEHNIGDSISLSALRKLRGGAGMSAREFQEHAKLHLGLRTSAAIP